MRHLQLLKQSRSKNWYQKFLNQYYILKILVVKNHKEIDKHDDMKIVNLFFFSLIIHHFQYIFFSLIVVCFLLNLARDLDEDFAEVNINDLVETTISAFAQILLSKNNMKVRKIFHFRINNIFYTL